MQENSPAALSKDELFNDAARLVVRHQKASSFLIQKHLKLGYVRACLLLNELMSGGIIVGVIEHSKPPKVKEIKVLFKTEKEVCDFLKIEYRPVNDCCEVKCAYPNCGCSAERKGIFIAGDLKRQGISNDWLKLWADIQNWYGDIQQTETQEQFLRRLQQQFTLSSISKNTPEI
jgi:hypothetical protein